MTKAKNQKKHPQKSSKEYVENMKKNQNKIENEKKDNFINKDGMKKSKKELVSRNNEAQQQQKLKI